jgi:two-component system nitrogen regulation sensor histidine kinase NtrY
VADEGGVLEECTATIIGEVEGLRRLVDEFTRFARMPRLAPAPTDVHRLLDGVVGHYREARPAVSLRTGFAPEMPVLEADPDQLKRAVLNLIDNAVEAGATEVVVTTRWERGAGRVQVVVADNGPGVLPELREKLFLPYFSTKTTGMGLGLPIVHQIVTDHSGQIRVDDNLPRGTRFVIDLPVLQPGHGPRAETALAGGTAVEVPGAGRGSG